MTKFPSVICLFLLATTVVQASESTYRIAFSFSAEGQSGTYVISADGAEQHRLTKGKSGWQPEWSPDGRQLAFLSFRMQDLDAAAGHFAFHGPLYTMDANGQNQRRISSMPLSWYHWSPDGGQFVFQSSYEDKTSMNKDGVNSSAIYVMKADGTQQKRLTPIEGDDSFPSWSPDGKRIAFCSNRDGNPDIFVMNPDGASVKKLTNMGRASRPVWSPDGKKIAFTSYPEVGEGNIFVVNADTTGSIPFPVRGSPIGWAPDGNSLLISNDRQISIIGTDGRNLKPLTEAGKPALDGAFSPDGKTVLYRLSMNGKGGIMSVEIESLRRKLIWSGPGSIIGFSISPLQKD